MSDSQDRVLEPIPSEECYRLLGTQQIGRLGVIAKHYPLIVPVNYALDGHTIVMRMDEGLKLTATNHANVTFEVDDIDQRARAGWSVLARGLAEEVEAHHRAELIERTRSTAVEPWAPGEHGHYVRLIVHSVTGRRIIPGSLPPPFEDASYL